MKTVSQQFRDQPEKPIERATWWIEWALRNPNNVHLASPTMHLGSFKSNLYDIKLFVIFVAAFIVYYLRKCLQNLSKRTVNDKNNKHRQNAKKKE
jgi:glucuronosyltransferase